MFNNARKWTAVSCVLAGVTFAIAVTPQFAAAATQKSAKPNVSGTAWTFDDQPGLGRFEQRGRAGTIGESNTHQHIGVARL